MHLEKIKGGMVSGLDEWVVKRMKMWGKYDKLVGANYWSLRLVGRIKIESENYWGILSSMGKLYGMKMIGRGMSIYHIEYWGKNGVIAEEGGRFCLARFAL